MSIHTKAVQILAGVAPRASSGSGAVVSKPILSLALPPQCAGGEYALWLFAPLGLQRASERRYEPICATRAVGAERVTMAGVLKVLINNERFRESGGGYDLRRQFALALLPSPPMLQDAAHDLADALSGQLREIIGAVEAEFLAVAGPVRWEVALNRWMNLREMRGLMIGPDVRAIWTEGDLSGHLAAQRIVDDALTVPFVPIVLDLPGSY